MSQKKCQEVHMCTAATALIFVFLSSMASADVKAADACKAKLSPIGQQIYAAALAQNPTEATGRGIVTKEVEKLMNEGKVSLLEGREAGEAAGNCLKKLK
ncbi:MAG: hypothetical protein ABJI96_21315 [Paracoccaceae bacterium]